MKADHFLSNMQIEVIYLLLDKINKTIEETQFLDLSYSDIKVLGSDYTTDVFVSFVKTNTGASQSTETFYWGVDVNGNLNDNAFKTMQFNNIADKVHFFNSLYEIELTK